MRESDSTELYQDETTRTINSCIFNQRLRYDSGEIKTWEYTAFKKMVRGYCKSEGLFFSEDEERIYRVKKTEA